MKRTVALTLAILTAVEAHFATANPQSFKLAHAQYESGDIPSCVQTLEKILLPKPKIGGNLLIEARKLYGISNFLLGKKDLATSVFKSVLAADPNAHLNPKDVLDPSISDFFESLKGNIGRGVAAPSPRPDGRTPDGRTPPARTASSASSPAGAARPGAPHPPAAGPRPQADPGLRAPRIQSPNSTSAALKGAPFTGIFIKTNVERSTIFANGIYIGTANQNIELEPGEHKITISSEGYESASKSFVLKAKEKLTISVKLFKEGARSSASAAESSSHPAPSEQQKGTPLAAHSKKQGKVDYGGDLTKPAGGASLADEFFKDQALGSVPPQPNARPAPQQGYPTQPLQGYAPPPQQGDAPPPQQRYAPPPQQRYAQPPQQGYAQPPQQGYAQPPQQGYANPSQQSAPQPIQSPQPPRQVPRAGQQPLYPPPPNVSQNQPPPYGAPNSAQQIQSPVGKKNYWLPLLSFGAGQYQNDQSGKGIFFTASHAVSLGAFGYFLYAERSYLKTAANDEAFLDAQGQSADVLDAKSKYAQDKKEYLAGLHSKQILTFGLFSGLVVWGIADAYYFIGNAPVRKLNSRPTQPRYSDGSTKQRLSPENESDSKIPTYWTLTPVALLNEKGLGFKLNVSF